MIQIIDLGRLWIPFSNVTRRDRFQDVRPSETNGWWRLEELVETVEIRPPLEPEALPGLLNTLLRIQPVPPHSGRYSSNHVPEVICLLVALQMLNMYFSAEGRRVVEGLRQRFQE